MGRRALSHDRIDVRNLTPTSPAGVSAIWHIASALQSRALTRQLQARADFPRASRLPPLTRIGDGPPTMRERGSPSPVRARFPRHAKARASFPRASEVPSRKAAPATLSESQLPPSREREPASPVRASFPRRALARGERLVSEARRSTAREPPSPVRASFPRQGAVLGRLVAHPTPPRTRRRTSATPSRASASQLPPCEPPSPVEIYPRRARTAASRTARRRTDREPASPVRASFPRRGQLDGSSRTRWGLARAGFPRASQLPPSARSQASG